MAVISQAARPSILSLEKSLSDTTIIYPESVETNTRQMMQNWYMRNYAGIDSLADFREPVTVSDEVIIERLSKMPTVIEMPFNSVVRNYIDMYTVKKRSLVENMLAMGNYYMPIFEQALEREQMPLELKYLPVIESALNPEAVSRVGATGLWQFMSPTAKGLGLEINSIVDERRDPVRSSEMAVKYLKQLHDIYNDWSLAIAAYNCGPGNVNKALRRAGDGKKDFWEIYPFLPAETRGYVPCFIAACYVMTYYNQHNIAPALTRRPIITDSVHINKRVHFKQISDILQIPVDEIRILNPQYRQDIIPGNIRPYPLVLPSHQIYSYLISEDSIVAHDATHYNPRLRVEPSDGTQINISEDGDYIITEKTQYHKVQRGENLSSIARRYGVTVSSIKSANGIKSVRRGQTIKIVTTTKAKRPESENDKIEARTDSLETSLEEAAMTEDAPETSAEIKKKEVKPEPKPAPKPVVKEQKTRTPVTVTVKSGDNLSKIAKRNRTTVAKIKQLNGLSSDRIKPGQRLRVK